MGLSEEEKQHVLSELREYMEQGLLCPDVKPSLLGIPPEDFVSNGLKFSGNPLPEFASVSRNVLDCFAAAVLSTPFLEIPSARVILRCRLREDDGELMLYLAAMLSSDGKILPLELSTDGEVWVATYLRPLCTVKTVSLGSIYWTRSGLHSFFYLAYPGRMVRSKVPGLGDLGEDGKPRWPECELLLERITPALLRAARSAIGFVNADQCGAVQ